METPESFFPCLNISKLSMITNRWVKEYPDIPFKSVAFYTHSNRLSKDLKGRVPVKYDVVFEIDQDNKTYVDYDKGGGEDKTDEQWTAEREQRMREPMTAVETFAMDTHNKLIIRADFQDVYKTPPPDAGFENEWNFIAKFRNEPMPLGVRIDEPHFVFFQKPKEKEATLRDDQQDKHLVQNAARLVWEKTPELAIKYMEKHSDINTTA